MNIEFLVSLRICKPDMSTKRAKSVNPSLVNSPSYRLMQRTNNGAKKDAEKRSQKEKRSELGNYPQEWINSLHAFIRNIYHMQILFKNSRIFFFFEKLISKTRCQGIAQPGNVSVYPVIFWYIIFSSYKQR